MWDVYKNILLGREHIAHEDFLNIFSLDASTLNSS